MTEKEKKRFYNSGAWQKKRDYILRRDHYECQECRRRIAQASAAGVRLPKSERNIRRATIVHHIKHLEDAWDLRLEDSNLEAVCERCHNLLHGRTVEGCLKRERAEPVTVERW